MILYVLQWLIARGSSRLVDILSELEEERNPNDKNNQTRRKINFRNILQYFILVASKTSISSEQNQFEKIFSF